METLMWEWELIAVDAAVGALAGALGWLATRRLRQTDLQSARNILVGCAVLGFILASQILAPMVKSWKERRELIAVGLETYANQSSAVLNAETFGAILRNPKLFARARAVQSAKSPRQTGVAELTAAGMARLDAADLDAIFGVKRALADFSPALCAAFWTGQPPAGALPEGLRQLTEDQQSIWITVSGRALSREMDSVAPPARISAAARDEAMADLTGSLSPEGRAALDQAARSSAPTTAVACRAFRVLADGAKSLPPAEREVFMRALNSPNLIDR
jgi:hypothetical protein